jgi:pimeloyl-ACP methyl ester carboxylesterase
MHQLTAPPPADVAVSEERRCDVGRGITLCYQTFGREQDPPLLLVMGLGMQMVGWPDDFCAALAARGLYVARFDNRDTGRSTHLDGPSPTPAQLLRRRIDPVPYTLSDMATDAAGLLRELGLGRAHVVGASMGGMIAQTIAAEHPEWVRSLVSIMSTTGRRFKGEPAFRVYRYLLREAPSDRAGFVEHMTRLFAVIGSSAPEDRERIREIAERCYERGLDPAGTGRQLGAILASGDRTAGLRRVLAPTLVIHGATDYMVRRSGGVATARAIPGARLMVVKGMGHDLPVAKWPVLLDAIARHAFGADMLEAAQGLLATA